MKEGVCVDSKDFVRSALGAPSWWLCGRAVGEVLEALIATGLLGDSLLERDTSGLLLGSTSCALGARVVFSCFVLYICNQVLNPACFGNMARNGYC